MKPNQLYNLLDNFESLYNEKGQVITKLPHGEKLTVYYKSQDEEGFLENITASEMGLEIFIVKAWIRQSELEKLTNATV